MPRAKWPSTATTSTHSMQSSWQATCRNKIHTYYNKRAGSDEEVSPFFVPLRILSNKDNPFRIIIWLGKKKKHTFSQTCDSQSCEKACFFSVTTLFLANKSFVCSVKGEVWEVVDDVHCLGADIDDSTGNVIVLMEVCARTA